MVGIYKYEHGLRFKAVSTNFNSAIKALFNKYATDYEKEVHTPKTWWENGKKWNCGAPRCYEIKEIEKW